jgi:hypothetical protein
MHLATCPQGCGGHGCCVGAGYCACDPGWTGPSCTVPLGTCSGAFAPQPGTLARFYNTAGALYGSLVLPTLTAQYGYIDANQVFLYEGIFAPARTGWHTWMVRTGRSSLWLDGRMVFGPAMQPFRAVHMQAGRPQRFRVRFVTSGYSAITVSVAGPNAFEVARCTAAHGARMTTARPVGDSRRRSRELRQR